MAWGTLTTLSSGQIIDKAWIDRVVDNINYLGQRSHVSIGAVNAGETTASTTPVAIAGLTGVYRPQASTHGLWVYSITLKGSVAGSFALTLRVNGGILAPQPPHIIPLANTDALYTGAFIFDSAFPVNTNNTVDMQWQVFGALTLTRTAGYVSRFAVLEL